MNNNKNSKTNKVKSWQDGLNFVTNAKQKVWSSIVRSSTIRFSIHQGAQVLVSLFGLLSLGLLTSQLFIHSAYAAFYVDVSSTAAVKLTETGSADGGSIKPSGSGTLGTGSDVVTVNTNCTAGYKLYASATATGNTNLNLSGASSSELQNSANYIAPSSNTPTAEGTLTKDTWGVGKTSSTFAGLQAYSADAGTWTPLYTATSTDISNNTSTTNPGTSTLTHDVYYGANISTAKTPGTYSGNVLYTVIMENACTEYTLKFDDGVDDSDTEAEATITSNLPNGIPTTETGGKGEYPKVKFGTSVDLSQYSTTEMIKRTGYTLKGWKIKLGNGTPSETVYPTDTNTALDDSETSDVTLVAVWEPNKYTIHYNSNAPSGTTASGTTADQTDQAYNATTTLRANGFSIAGYNFAGWAYTANGTKAFDSAQENVSIKTLAENNGTGSVVDENNATINLYALWTKASYTLTVSNGNTTAISSVSGGGTKTYGASVTASCTPKSGYHCTGWTSSNTSLLPSSSNASYTFNMPAGSLTLTATGAANSFTIYYNSNGGSGTTSSQTATYGTNVNLRANSFTAPEGKKFKEWNTSSDGSGTTYSGGQTGVSPTALKPNVTTVNGGSITLYAIWEDATKYFQTTNVCSTLPTADTSILRDNRDNQDYTVYRWGSSAPDGMANYCIMTKDLSLGYVTGGSITKDTNLTLTADDSAAAATIAARPNGSGWSSTDSDSNRQYMNGPQSGQEAYSSHSYYSYGAAQKVCPKGWRPPTHAEHGSIVSFMDGNNSTGSSTIRSAPYNFVYGGYFYSGGWGDVGSYGYYWSSTRLDSSDGYSLYFNSSNLRTSFNSKNLGFSVRCISN